MALGGRIAYVMAMTQPHRPVGPGDHVFLIDGSSFVFRAYYQSIRQDQKYNYRTDRLPTGAVRLFATKVLQFIRDGAGRFQADPSRHHLRQDGELLPARHLPALQGAPEGPSGRTGAAVPADARHRFGLRHGPDRAGPLRGRRHHRHLRAPGAPGRRRRSHRLGRQGPHAARRAGRVDVRSGFGPSRGRRLSRGAALRRRTRSKEYFGVGPDRVVDVQALAGDSTDNVPGAPGHRAQDRGSAHHRIWRSRDAARPRGRDQAAQAARSADQSRDRQAYPGVEAARHFGSGRAGRDAARGARDAGARRQAAHRPFARRWSSRPSLAASPRSAASTWRRSSRTRASSAPRRGRAARAWRCWNEKEMRRQRARPLLRRSLLPRRASPRSLHKAPRPTDLAAARAKEARAPIDRTAYKIVRTAAELSAWIARARG